VFSVTICYAQRCERSQNPDSNSIIQEYECNPNDEPNDGDPELPSRYAHFPKLEKNYESPDKTAGLSSHPTPCNDERASGITTQWKGQQGRELRDTSEKEAQRQREESCVGISMTKIELVLDVQTAH
jgi:hypothetical protein